MLARTYWGKTVNDNGKLNLGNAVSLIKDAIVRSHLQAAKPEGVATAELVTKCRVNGKCPARC